MGTYVLGADAAVHLAATGATVRSHELLAPTLIRSQVLARLYAAVRAGELTFAEADAQLSYLRGLRMRLLGDRVLQRTAWKVAADLDLPDTFDAEYIALTRLHGDALVTLDADLVRRVRGVVEVASVDVLTGPPR